MLPPFRGTGAKLDVLEVLLGSDGELHGWAIMRASGRSRPTVYQILDRLSRSAGWRAGGSGSIRFRTSLDGASTAGYQSVRSPYAR
jgi:hypothetical protein